MIKKIALSGVIILIALSFLVYNFIYTPLTNKQEELMVELGQKMNNLEQKEKEVNNLEEIETEYKEILKQLEHQYAAKLSSSSKINSFIIELNTPELVVDVESVMGDNLRIELELVGEYQEIYDFISQINYIYDATDVIITKEAKEIRMELTLLFPIERRE